MYVCMYKINERRKEKKSNMTCRSMRHLYHLINGLGE